jgi:hypothetical protein
MWKSAAAVLVLAALLAGPAQAATENDLAERYAPVVRVVDQPEECGHGEPYEPMDVDALFGEDTVSLRGPWTTNDLIQVAPTADALGKGLWEYNLDFPGNSLEPGCTYEQWARRLNEGTRPTVYAHVAHDPDYPESLALQYWLFYPFNDWNNNHEGDWEMIQFVFDAPTVDEALAKGPAKVGYSQHEGAERADWDDEKLRLVDGTHPVVYPGAGSHANFYEDALFIGRSAQEGVGCDDTTGPSRELRPVVRTIPSDEAEARKAFPWIAYEGRWGERQRAFLNGPTGPNLKTQWTAPITWAEGWRDQAYAIPAGGHLGTDATDFFCDAVAAGSSFFIRLNDNPQQLLLILAVLAALLVYAFRRTSWRPSTPLRVVRRRSWGQTLTASARMYSSHPSLFVGIGLITIPISVVITTLQLLVVHASGVIGVGPDAEGGGFRVALVVWLGTVLTLLGLAIVQAACARGIAEIDARRDVNAVRAFALSLDSVGPLVGALALAVAVVSLLTLSIFLVPIAIWLVVRWALIVPCAELEDLDWRGALRRSGELVRHQWLKVGTLVVAAAAFAIVIGPLIGALLLFIPGAPLALVNLAAGLIYAVAMPFVGITTTYVYYDTLVRERLQPEVLAELPAEAT